MSWTTLNEILGLAIVDPTFRRKLLHSPLHAIHEREFVLSPEETCVLQRFHAHDLVEFSQYILDHLGSEQ